MKHLHRRLLVAFNGLLTLLLVSIAHTSCNEPSYIGPIDGLDTIGVDTMVHCMYGVEPVSYPEKDNNSSYESDAQNSAL